MSFRLIWFLALTNIFGNYSFYLNEYCLLIPGSLHQPGNISNHSFSNFLLKHFKMKSKCFANILLSGNSTQSGQKDEK